MLEWKTVKYSNYTWTVTDPQKGHVTSYGTDFGNGSRPIEIVSQTTDLLVLKIPSHKTWMGIGLGLYTRAVHDMRRNQR